MDERVFARIMAKQGGLDPSEAELTSDACRTIVALCHQLSENTPFRMAESWEAYYRRARLRLPPPEPPRRSGSAIIEICVDRALPRDREVAFRAFCGLHPELRSHPGAFRRYRPVARAALARDLRRIARPVIASFALNRFTDTDRYVDADGVRRAGPES